MGTRLRPGKFSCDVRNRPLPSDARHARRQGPPRHLMHTVYASWIFRDGSIAGLSPRPLGWDRNVVAGRRGALSGVAAEPCHTRWVHRAALDRTNGSTTRAAWHDVLLGR